MDDTDMFRLLIINTDWLRMSDIDMYLCTIF